MIPAAKLREISSERLEELNRAVVAELRYRYAVKQREAMREFRIGQKVQWYSEKRGGMVQIVITDFNRKTITGKETMPGGRTCTWRVAPSMLELVPA
jgi:hypothetical protein